MNTIVVTYLVYLMCSVALTVWVAQTLHKNGRVFLVDVFHGNEGLADSVNHLLVVGFYLINIGYVTLRLKIEDGRPQDGAQALEFLSGKVGLVLVIGANLGSGITVYSTAIARGNVATGNTVGMEATHGGRVEGPGAHRD